MCDKNQTSKYNSFYAKNSKTKRLARTTLHNHKKKREILKALGNDHFLVRDAVTPTQPLNQNIFLANDQYALNDFFFFLFH